MSECSIALTPKPAASLSSPATSSMLQRQCACGQRASGGECEECKKKQTTLQRNPSGAGPTVAPPIVHEALRSPAEPLPADSRSFFEPRFGRRFSPVPARRSEPPSVPLKISHPDERLETEAENSAERVLRAEEPTDQAGVDLSRVRVHTGSKAAEAAWSVGSRAFTVGHDLVFNAGEYQPQSPGGRRLLAHELSHVVQQTTSPHSELRLFRQIAVSPPDPVNAVPPTGVGPDTEGMHDVKTEAKKDDKPDAAGAKKPDGDGTDSNDVGKSAKAGPPSKADTKVDAKSRISKIANQSPVGKDAAAPEKDDQQAAAEVKAEAQSVTDLGTGDLATIDAELAEHQRWGAATATVGAAGSGERAQFIAQSAAAGSGFGEALVKGAATGAGMKIAEKAVEKGALKLAARFAPQVTKFTPLPAVGAVIGGVMSAYDLASRDWKATGESIGRFGQGAEPYETLANSIESISTILDVATAVLNVIAGIIGAISIAMWIITIITVGIASPLALTLSTIAGGIGLASLILDGINAVVLKQLITLFRALHAFTSDADPRDVVVQGDAITKASGAATGFVGGFAGGMAGGAAAEKGIKMGAKAMAKPPSTPVPDHPMPPAAGGDGPGVKAQAPEVKTGTTEVKSVPGPEATANAPADKPVATSAASTTASAGPIETQPTAKPTAPASEARPSTKPTKGGGGSGNGGGGQGNGPKGAPRGPEPKLTEAQRAFLEEVGEKRRMAKGGGLVDDEFRAGVASAEKRPQALRRGEKMPGRWEPTGTKAEVRATKQRVEASQRRIARRLLAKLIQDELKGNVDGPLSAKARPFLGDRAMDFIRRTGRFPKGKGGRAIEVHHLLTIADFPEFGGRGEETIPIRKEAHTQAGHVGDTTRPLEAATLLDPGAVERRGFVEDVEAKKGTRTRSKKRIAEGLAASTEEKGGIDQDILIDQREQLAKLRKQAQKKPSAKLTKEITLREAALQQLEATIANKNKAVPSAVKPAAPAVTIPPAASPTTVAEVHPAPTVESLKTVDAPQSTVLQSEPAQPETKVRIAEDVVPEPETKVRVASPDESGKRIAEEDPTEAEVEPEQLPLKNLRLGLPTPGDNKKADSEEEESGFQRNLRQFGETDPQLMKAARVGMYLPGGAVLSATAFTAAAARTAARSFEQARREPIVEHVNPHYPPPPCSPQDIVNVQNQILETLDDRAKTEALSAESAKQQAHHKANEKPLADMQKGTDDALSATEAHQQAVARRTDANQKKQKNEDQAAGMLSDYSNRAAKLSTITVPMRGFERFTSLAYSMPDDPQVLPLAVQPFSGTIIRAKKAILKMNTDSKNFLKQLDTMDGTIKDQKATQSDRDKQVQTDAKTLTDTKQKAGESDQSLNQAKQTTQDLDNTNKDRLDQATKIHNEADQASATLDRQAQQKQDTAQSMAAALQAWAPQHRQARLDALEQTRKNLEQQGYKIIEVKEL